MEPSLTPTEEIASDNEEQPKRLIDFSPLRLPMKKPTTKYEYDENAFVEALSEIYAKMSVWKAEREAKEEFLRIANGQEIPLDIHSEYQAHLERLASEIPQEKRHDESGTFNIPDSDIMELVDLIDEEENAITDNDFLLQLIKTIKKLRKRFSSEPNDKQVGLIKQYIQISLDIIFQQLTEKYNFVWIYDERFSSRMTADDNVLDLLMNENYMENLAEKIRNFKTKFEEVFQMTFDNIENTIDLPQTQKEIFDGITDDEGTKSLNDPEQETRSKFLMYYKNTGPQRTQKKNQFTDELINTIVFQYIFGVPVLGEHFMEFSEQLSIPESDTIYPFDMKNSFLFGWASKSKQPLADGIKLEMVLKIPGVIDKLNEYRTNVAKNAALNIIRCQFSAWTIMTFDENQKFKRETTEFLKKSFKTLLDQGQSMDFEVTKEEKDEPDYDPEYLNAFKDWIEGKTIPKNYQDYNYETRTRIPDIMKPTNITTYKILQRNLLKKTKSVFSGNRKQPSKKMKEMDLVEEKE